MEFDLSFTSKSGKTIDLPIFIPVFRPGFSINTLGAWEGDPQISACMVNAFLLYKDASKKKQFEDGLTLSEYVGDFNGLLCTDSGAFQGFKGAVYLKNKVIVKFQDMIKTDIAAPLDLITPPGDNKSVALKKLISTQKRTREALELLTYSTLAGIQQGGSYFDLRQQSIRELVDMGITYYGLGSLVPFFNKNHDLRFVAKIIKDARSAIGRKHPIHVYGAGDPLEIPFMVYLGANIFDSSSYAHYANKSYYMTPYGAVNDITRLNMIEYQCTCPHCSTLGLESVHQDKEVLSKHNLWTICTVIEDIKVLLKTGKLEERLQYILLQHTKLEPNSALQRSWEEILAYR